MRQRPPRGPVLGAASNQCSSLAPSKVPLERKRTELPARRPLDLRYWLGGGGLSVFRENKECDSRSQAQAGSDETDDRRRLEGFALVREIVPFVVLVRCQLTWERRTQLVGVVVRIFRTHGEPRAECGAHGRDTRRRVHGDP